MGKALTSIAIGIGVVGLAFLTGGASIGPSLAFTSAGTVATASIATALTTTAIGSALLTVGAGAILSGVASAFAGRAAISAGTGLTSRVSIDPDIGQWLVVGKTALPTQLIYFGTSGVDNKNLSMIFVHSCHKINALTDLTLNNVATAFPTPSGAYAGILTIETTLGGHTTNPFTSVNGGGQWGSAQIGRDLCMSHFRWTYDDEKLSSGLPQNIQFVGEGQVVYDPRRDSTRGGSGSMRADDQTTWAYKVGGDEIGRNPALVELTYRLGWKKNGRLWGGMGEDPANFDYASYIAAANICDELPLGGERYRIDGLLSLADMHNVNLGKIAATCGGKQIDVGGLIGFWVAADDTATAVMTLNEGDWIGDLGWQPLAEDAVRNTARGSFIDASNFYQQLPYPEIAPSDLRTLDNGEELADNLDFIMVQSAYQASRLAAVRLRESRQGKLVVPAALKAMGLRPTQVVAINHPRMGWSNKKFRVETMELAIDRVQLTLRAVKSSDYTDFIITPEMAAANVPTLGYVPIYTPNGNLFLPATPVIRADFDGTVLTGQLPRTMQVTRSKNNADVTASTTWSVTPSGCTASISSAGVITITAISTTGKIVVTSVYDGVTISGEIAVIKENAPPPVVLGGGGGNPGTSASDSTISSTSSTSYGSANGGPLTVVAGTGGGVALSAPLSFSTSGSTSGAAGKWQWRPIGGSWSDVDSEIADTLDALSGDPNSGYIEVTQSKTGLTAGTSYEFQLLLRRVGGTGTLTFSGSASAVGS